MGQAWRVRQEATKAVGGSLGSTIKARVAEGIGSAVKHGTNL